MQLWFLLIDGGRFHAKGVDRKYSNFYQERMKSLGKVSDKMPTASYAYKKFMDNNVFGKGEEEVVHPDEEEQRGFMAKFDVEINDEVKLHGEKCNTEWAEWKGTSDSTGSLSGPGESLE